MKLKKKKRTMTLGRIGIAKYIASNLGLSKTKSLLYLDGILFLMIKNIKDNKYLSIVNFGRFILHSKKEHKGFHPKTRHNILIPERDCILFRYSKHLKHFVNDSKVQLKMTNYSNQITKELKEHLNSLQMDICSKICSMIVNLFFKTIATELKKNRRLELRNFGTFGTRKHKPRKSRNPQTGETTYVRSKIVPFFKYSKHMFN